MPNYKRVKIPGGTYFFTVNLANRKHRLLVEHFDLLSYAVNRTRQSRPFHIKGWVVLPDHLHCLWTLPENDANYSGRWSTIKKHFTLRCKQQLPGIHFPVWQLRFWEHAIRGREDFERHLDYIHINPVKHGYVKQVKDWPYSSFHHYVAKGVYSADWGGGDESFMDFEFGE